jgi:hypothetical protein
MLLTLAGCAGQRFPAAEPPGLRAEPADSTWAGALKRPAQALSARGRLSLRSASGLPFTLLMRNDSLQLLVKSRVGSEVARALVTSDSMFLYVPSENTRYAFNVNATGTDAMLTAASHWKSLIENRVPNALIKQQLASKRYVKQHFSDGSEWLISKKDSLVVYRRFGSTGTEAAIQKHDTDGRPLSLQVTGASEEMPIFVSVSGYSPAGFQPFKLRIPPKTITIRP